MPLESFWIEDFPDDVRVLESSRPRVEILLAFKKDFIRFLLHLWRVTEQGKMAKQVGLIDGKRDTANQPERFFKIFLAHAQTLATITEMEVINAVCFCVLMDHHRQGVEEAHPSYIREKLEIFEKCDEESALSLLDAANQARVRTWKQTWQ